MIYTKVEITPGVTLNLDIDTDELYTICPSCGIEHHIEYELAVDIDDWESTITCGNESCNQKQQEKYNAAT